MYKLEKNSPYKNLKYNLNTYFNKTTRSLKGFVACSTATGIVYGVLYGMNAGASTTQMIENGGGESALLLFIASLWLAKRTYKSFKEEKSRWILLTTVYEKEHLKNSIHQPIDLTREETPFNYFDNNSRKPIESLDEINERLKKEELKNLGPEIHTIKDNFVDDGEGTGYSKILMPK